MSVCCFRNTNVPLTWFVLYQLNLELCSEQVNVIYNVLIKLFYPRTSFSKFDPWLYFVWIWVKLPLSQGYITSCQTGILLCFLKKVDCFYFRRPDRFGGVSLLCVLNQLQEKPLHFSPLIVLPRFRHRSENWSLWSWNWIFSFIDFF